MTLEERIVKKKTDEWIEGYVYGKAERKFLESRIHKNNYFLSSVCVPKIWFGLREYKSKTNTLDDERIKEFKYHITQTLKAHAVAYNYIVDIFPDEQYIYFTITGVKHEPVKEMTVKEI